MTIKRYGVEGGTGTGGQHLHVQLKPGGFTGNFWPDAMTDGEVVEGGIGDQSRLAIQNCVDMRR